MSDELSPAQFGAAFQRFMEWVAGAGEGRSPFADRLRGHFGAAPDAFPVVSERLMEHDRPNLQVALDAWLAVDGRSAELIGFTGPGGFSDMTPSLSGLLHEGLAQMGVREGPVEYATVTLDRGRRLACVRSGLFLIRDGERRLAAVVGSQQHGMEPAPLRIEVMGARRDECERFLAELLELRTRLNVYRGKTISVGAGPHGGGLSVTFHDLPDVPREAIVLPDGVLERVERHTVEFSRERDRMLAAGRHLKRGLLLHGPPGTGKTLTITHLAGRLERHTVVLLAGAGLGTVRESCALARQLQPSLVVLEDVDLVASERTFMGVGTTALLFELLNEMDGLADDADVIFAMTTNRPDLLEPALAQRPGRIDQAVHLPLPDEPGRRRLLDLFCHGLTLDGADLHRAAAKTDGASPAFLRESIRRAALIAATQDRDAIVQADLDDALVEMREGGELMRSILGSRRAEP